MVDFRDKSTCHFGYITDECEFTFKKEDTILIYTICDKRFKLRNTCEYHRTQV